MKAVITEVDFDLDGSDNLDLEQVLRSQVIGSLVEYQREDEIADLITDDTGWCVRSVSWKEEVNA